MNARDLITISIEKKFGKKMESFSTITDFSEILEKEHKVFISISTLRRFFKTVKTNSRPSKSTLNGLSQYLGFENYEKFLEDSFTHNAIFIQQSIGDIKLAQHINSDQWEIILNELSIDLLSIFIESILQRSLVTNNVQFQKQILDLIKELVENRKVSFLKENLALLVWQTLVIEEDHCFKLFVSNHISNPTFLNYVIFSYIDYDHLNGRYGKVLESINSEDISIIQNLFITAILGLKNYLLGNNVEQLPNKYPIEIKGFPDILLGRLMAYPMLQCQQNRKNDNQFSAILEQAKRTKNKNLFFIEVVHTLLILKRVDLLEQLITQFYEDLFEISDGFTYLNRSIYLLAHAFVFLEKNDLKSAQHSLSLINYHVIKERPFHLWFKLFYFTAAYHANKDDSIKATSKQQFLACSEQVNLPFFNISFCTGYFVASKQREAQYN